LHRNAIFVYRFASLNTYDISLQINVECAAQTVLTELKQFLSFNPKIGAAPVFYRWKMHACQHVQRPEI